MHKKKASNGVHHVHGQVEYVVAIVLSPGALPLPGSYVTVDPRGGVPPHMTLLNGLYRADGGPVSAIYSDLVDPVRAREAAAGMGDSLAARGLGLPEHMLLSTAIAERWANKDLFQGLCPAAEHEALLHALDAWLQSELSGGSCGRCMRHHVTVKALPPPEALPIRVGCVSLELWVRRPPGGKPNGTTWVRHPIPAGIVNT